MHLDVAERMNFAVVVIKMILGLTETNYSFTAVDGTLTVTPAVLTVTAANVSRAYGAADPAFSSSYAGFVNGDTPASLTTPVSQ